MTGCGNAANLGYMPTRQSSAAVIKYARCHGESFGADAVALGAVHQELRDLMAMVK